MPTRKKCKLLPQTMRDELNRRLIENAFGGYKELELWLKSKGYNISHQAIWHYGQEFEKKLDKIDFLTQQAKAICDASVDEENALAEALTKLAQQKAFERLLTIDHIEENTSFTSLVRSIADLNRSSVSLKKYRQELKDKLSLITTELSQKAGLSDDVAQQIREKILGVI